MALTSSEPLDVLHVASFVGNIGDNANHNGTRRQLRSNLGADLRFEELEMRKYYQNYSKEDSLSFDDHFVQKANSCDLVLIGGGSFFDIWIDDSETGTTIDLSKEQIDQIETPLVFHGLGCVPKPNVSENLVDRFRGFLDHLFESDHTLVSVRNDGSIKNIADTVGQSYAERITKIPDGAFFLDVDSTAHPEVPQDGTVIGINVVSDMRNRRFPGGDTTLDYEGYITEFSKYIDKILEEHPDLNIVLIPHIYSDLTAISDILSKTDLWYRRDRVTTAPYLNGMGSERYIFDIYDTVDLTMGLRLHSNVCPIGLGTPSIGLANGHPKVSDLYEDLGFAERTVSVHEEGFSERLLDKTEQSLSEQPNIRDRYEQKAQNLAQDMDSFHDKIEKLVDTEH